MNRRLLSYLLTGALCAAGVAMIIGALSPHEHTIYRLALGVATLAGTGLMVLRTRISVAAMERIRLEGFDAGFSQGAAAAGVVIADLTGGSGAAVLSLVSPPSQLVEQDGIASSADRVG